MSKMMKVISRSISMILILCSIIPLIMIQVYADSSKPSKPTPAYEGKFDLTDYINEVTERYDEVRDMVKNNDDVKKVNVIDGVVLRLYKKKPIRLEIQNGVDDFNYTRIFTYDENGNLIFCYYENPDDSYRMYFLDNEIVKMTYKNPENDIKYEARLEDAQIEYADWAEYALYESSYYVTKAGY